MIYPSTTKPVSSLRGFKLFRYKDALWPLELSLCHLILPSSTNGANWFPVNLGHNSGLTGEPLWRLKGTNSLCVYNVRGYFIVKVSLSGPTWPNCSHVDWNHHTASGVYNIPRRKAALR